MKEDEALCSVMAAADLDNFIMGGHSFGGATSWLAGREKQDDECLKGLLLLDPWLTFATPEDLRKMDWTLPAYIVTSEQWLNDEKYWCECTQTVVETGSHEATVWEYGKRTT